MIPRLKLYKPPFFHKYSRDDKSTYEIHLDLNKNNLFIEITIFIGL